MYFFTGRDDERLIKYEAAVWNDERVGLAARLFNCYRISLDDMLLEADRKRFGKKGPNVVLIDSKGKTIKSFPGWRTTSSQVYGAMESLVNKTWKKRLGSLQPEIASILKELDELHAKLEKLKATLKSAEAHVKEHDCAPGRKRIKTTRAAIKDAEARLAKVLAKEKALLDFAGVGGEPAPAQK